MHVLRVYVETSVWSFALAEDVPDYRAETLAFLDQCRGGAIEPFVSTLVLDEIQRSEEPLRTRLTALVQQVRPVLLEFSSSAARLAQAFVHEGVVPAKKPEDAGHVAVAFVAELDVLVSWNFRHIVNFRRSERFGAVAVLEGYYRPLRIVTPGSLVYGEGIDSD